MTLRRRLMLAGASVVAATVLLAGLAAWLAVRVELRDQVDHSLREQAAVVARSAEHVGPLAHEYETEGKHDYECCSCEPGAYGHRKLLR